MAKKKRYFEFGEFQLYAQERALLRNGEALQLTPKAFNTLRILVENAGSLVEKDEMMRAIWPDSFVEEIGLARNLSVLRKALRQAKLELIKGQKRIWQQTYFWAPLVLIGQPNG